MIGNILALHFNKIVLNGGEMMSLCLDIHLFLFISLFKPINNKADSVPRLISNASLQVRASLPREFTCNIPGGVIKPPASVKRWPLAYLSRLAANTNTQKATQTNLLVILTPPLLRAQY